MKMNQENETAVALVSAGAKFNPGKIGCTQNAAEVLSETEMFDALNRHLTGDWGDLCVADRTKNDNALRSGEDRLFSAYHTENDEKFWIITERDRSYTTVLLPSDY
jgi:hypothetical protein